MKAVLHCLIIFLILVTCTSCNKEIKGLKEELKVLRDENNYLKAENVALKKELEDLYKKIEEEDLVKQKPVAKEKEENLNKENTSKIPDRIEPDKTILP